MIFILFLKGKLIYAFLLPKHFILFGSTEIEPMEHNVVVFGAARNLVGTRR